MTTRIPEPLTQMRSDVRPSIEWNQSHFVTQLVNDGDVSRCLDDLVVAVVAGSHSRCAECETAFSETAVFGSIRWMESSMFGDVGGSVLCLGRQRRHSPVGWIDNE